MKSRPPIGYASVKPMAFWCPFSAVPCGMWSPHWGYRQQCWARNTQRISHLEDHPMTSKWLITMVIVSPLRIGLFHFQMGVSWLINGAYYPLTNWDDPPSRTWRQPLALPTSSSSRVSSERLTYPVPCKRTLRHGTLVRSIIPRLAFFLDQSRKAPHKSMLPLPSNLAGRIVGTPIRDYINVV